MRILVTGGNSQIGHAIICRLIKKSHQLLTTASSPETYENLDTVYNTQPIERCIWNWAPPQTQNIPWTITSFIEKGIDVVILNAAPQPHEPTVTHCFQTDELHSSFNDYVTANFLLTQVCLRQMTKQKFGRIVLISSIAVHGIGKKCLYSMSKAALESMIKSIAIDYGHLNIYANTIRPGLISTDRNATLLANEDYMRAALTMIPANKIGTANSVAETIDPFISENSYINGTSLDISGGSPMIRQEVFFSLIESTRKSRRPRLNNQNN